jgi:transposase-like protein
VKLQLKEGLPVFLLSKKVGASQDGIRRWMRAYQERGEAGVTESDCNHGESMEASRSGT